MISSEDLELLEQGKEYEVFDGIWVYFLRKEEKGFITLRLKSSDCTLTNSLAIFPDNGGWVSVFSLGGFFAHVPFEFNNLKFI